MQRQRAYIEWPQHQADCLSPGPSKEAEAPKVEPPFALSGLRPGLGRQGVVGHTGHAHPVKARWAGPAGQPVTWPTQPPPPSLR
jgi:hypothetical protein